MDEEHSPITYFSAFISGFIFGSLLVMIYGIQVEKWYQKTAIEYGYAQYESESGRWTWKYPIKVKEKEKRLGVIYEN